MNFVNMGTEAIGSVIGFSAVGPCTTNDYVQVAASVCVGAISILRPVGTNGTMVIGVPNHLPCRLAEFLSLVGCGEVICWNTYGMRYGCAVGIHCLCLTGVWDTLLFEDLFSKGGSFTTSLLGGFIEVFEFSPGGRAKQLRKHVQDNVAI